MCHAGEEPALGTSKLGPLHENQLQVWPATQKLPKDRQEEVCVQAPPGHANWEGFCGRLGRPTLPLMDLVKNDVSDS